MDAMDNATQDADDARLWLNAAIQSTMDQVDSAISDADDARLWLSAVAGPNLLTDDDLLRLVGWMHMHADVLPEAALMEIYNGFATSNSGEAGDNNQRDAMRRYAWETHHALYTPMRVDSFPGTAAGRGAFFNPHDDPEPWVLNAYGLPPAPAPAKRATTPLRPLVVDGHVTHVSSDRVTRNITNSVRGTVPFVENDKGILVSTAAEKDHFIYTSISEADLTTQTQEAARSIMKKLGDYEGDIFRIALAAYALSNGMHRGEDGTVSVHVDEFLKARGIEPMYEDSPDGRRPNGYRTEDKVRVADAFRSLARLRVEVLDTKYDKGYIRETAVLVVDLLSIPQGVAPTGIEFKPGNWFERRTQGSVPQFAATPQWVYKFDPVREGWEKRLGEYITDFLRIDKKPELTREVCELLEPTGLWKYHNPKHPGETRKHFEAAMHRLVATGVIGSWDYKGNVASARPPRYGAIEQWRRWSVVIRPTSEDQRERARRIAAAEVHAGRRPGRPRKAKGKPRGSADK